MLLCMPDLQAAFGISAVVTLPPTDVQSLMYLLMQCTIYVTLLAQTQASRPSVWASELPQTLALAAHTFT